MPYDPTIEKYASYFYAVSEGETPPPVGDGVTYSRALGWQSPEGNFYGQERWVRDWPVGVVWDGEDYRAIEADGEATSPDALPIPGEINPKTGLPYGPRLHFEIWAVPRPNWPPTDLKVYEWRDKEFYYWDSVSQTWNLIEWLWSIDGEEDLPRPGVGVGKAHILYYYDIKVMWNGYAWGRFKHSMMEDDEPWLHVPEGFMIGYGDYQTTTNGAIQFLQSQQAEARLEFISKTNLSLVTSVSGKTGAIWVNGELLLVDDLDGVNNTDTAIHYVDGSVTTVAIDCNTEYNVYCGNDQFSPRSNSLFLSRNPDINGRLGTEELGLNARIVGVVETDSAGYFIREIDQSIIGKKVEFSETYWEYSDFQLQFVDQDALAFNRIDGTHGLCYINGQLLYLGSGKDLLRDSYRIEWDNGPDLDMTNISAETTYQIYIANDSVEFNFNNEDEETGLPYEEGHSSYIWQVDFRRRLFLSTQPHDHRVFNQEYPGYYARHIGQVQTDENGCFKYAADISLIRQPTLNPTHLDGLAECVVQDVSTSEFLIIPKKGTTGIVYVGGKPVQTYDYTNENIKHLTHKITVDDKLYTYNELNITSPLVDTGLSVKEKPGVLIYVYLANDISCWDSIRIFALTSPNFWGPVFCSLDEPHGGYLSANWPGNQARWIATIQLAPASTGSEKVTNGGFATDSSWTKGANWEWSSQNQNMAHTPGSAATLSQNVSAVAGELYAVTFYISGRTAGIASPRVGGVIGQSISANTSSTQYLLASTTGNLEITPDTYFDGAVDNVSVKKVTTGQFSGTYIKDSVSGVSAQIDDSIVSNSTTYSSNKIEQIKQQLLAKINLALGLNGSHTAGLDLQLEYINSTTIRLKAISTDIDVVFPNLETITVTTAGINKTVTGSIDTLYYVYLVTDGTLAITTNEPTDVYSNISFYGETHVLVGYMACSASNTIDGTHNIFSFWNEPARTYSVNIISTSSTLSLDGLLIPSGVIATWSKSGSSIALLHGQVTGFYYFNLYNTLITGNNTTYAGGVWTYSGIYIPNNEFGVEPGESVGSLTLQGNLPNSIASGIYYGSIGVFNIVPTYILSSRFTSMGGTGSVSWTSHSGALTLTRPGNI